MKLFKKLSAVLIALVLAFAMFAFAACGGGDDSNPNDNNENNNNQQQGGGSGGGGNEGSSDETGDDEVTPASIVAALEKAEMKFINVDFKQARERHVIEGETEQTATEDLTLFSDILETSSYKFDVVKGNMDLLEQDTYKYDDSSHLDSYYASSYMFKRDGHTFVYEQEGVDKLPDVITDWSDKTLSVLAEEQYGIYAMIYSNVDKLASVPRINIALVNLAKQTNSITIADGKATVDMNKLIDKTLADIDADLQTVSSTTTLGAVLEKDAIKTYLPILVNVLTADEIVSLAKLYLSTPEAPTYPLYAVFDGEDKVSPDANSTAWEYLIKLFKSEELKTAVNSVLTGMGIEDTITADSLYDVSCKYVMGLVGQIMSMISGGSGNGNGDPQVSPSPSPQPVDPQEGQGSQGAGQQQPTLADTTTEPEEDEVKDALEIVHELSEAATAEKLVLETTEQDDYTTTTTRTISGMKLEYTLNGSDITAMNLVLNIYEDTVNVSGSQVPDSYKHTTRDVDQTINVTFTDTGSLADISEAKTDAIVCTGELVDEMIDSTDPENPIQLKGIEGVKKAEFAFSIVGTDSKKMPAFIIKLTLDDNTVKKFSPEFYNHSSSTGDNGYHTDRWGDMIELKDDVYLDIEVNRIAEPPAPVLLSVKLWKGDISNENALCFGTQESASTVTVKAYLAAFAA